MEKKDLVKFELENGENIEMEIIKEFEYKDKKYAVLLTEEGCHCDDHCECDDECDCDSESEEGECDLCILEVVKDKEGKDTFKDIENKKEFEDVVKQAEKLFYEEEK